MSVKNVTVSEHHEAVIDKAAAGGKAATLAARPNLEYLSTNFAQAINSFYDTVTRIIADNPVDTALLFSLKARAGANTLSKDEAAQFAAQVAAAQRQGKAVATVIGFFLKFKPYPMFSEVRDKEAVFQPVFGPLLVVGGDAVRDVLTRHDEFTVDPYGVEMAKSMTPADNGGFDTFILSTDDTKNYIDDKRLLTSVVRAEDAKLITSYLHQECQQRMHAAVQSARENSALQFDVVPTLARFVPVMLGHHYLGVRVAAQRASFDLSDAMLKYYGEQVVGPDGVTPLPTSYQRPNGEVVELPDTALQKQDGVIPDEATVYAWIVAAFRHFFNNVQKDIEVQVRGVRAVRELLVYILREVDLQRLALKNDPDSVPDNMLTRLLKMQMGLSPLDGIDPIRVCDLRIAENVMGTMVGAVAGQEEATCRVLDSMIRLKDGEFDSPAPCDDTDSNSYGNFDKARSHALKVLSGKDVDANRAAVYQYIAEALRLQPQGEVLLRVCAKDGAVISGSRPLAAGTLVFAAHGSAMHDTESASAFILNRDQKFYLQYGYDRHKCLGQYVSPVVMGEALIALLGLENVRRPQPRDGETAVPSERRFGRFQLDNDNLYAKTFTLEFDDSGSTTKFYS